MLRAKHMHPPRRQRAGRSCPLPERWACLPPTRRASHGGSWPLPPPLIMDPDRRADRHLGIQPDRARHAQVDTAVTRPATGSEGVVPVSAMQRVRPRRHFRAAAASFAPLGRANRPPELARSAASLGDACRRARWRGSGAEADAPCRSPASAWWRRWRRMRRHWTWGR